MKLLRIFLIFWRNFNLLFFLSLVFVLSCCKENPPEPQEDELPPLTHLGYNTFGCKVNGVNWRAQTPFSVGGPATLSGNYSNDIKKLQLSAVRENDNYFEEIKISVNDVTSEGTYFMNTLNIDNDPIRCYRNYNDAGGICSVFFHDTLNPGVIEITYFNPSEQIISGTFSMTIKQNNCPDSLMYITDGRFDLKY